MARKEQEFAVSFPLDLGIDNTAHETAVQPFGQGAALVASTNTRLSKTRGIPTKAPGAVELTDPAFVAPDGSTTCGGIIPCGFASSSLVIRNRDYAPQRIMGTKLRYLDALPGHDTAFWPADVPRAGAVPARGQYQTPATVLLDEQMWFASCRTDSGGGVSIYVAVVGANGEIEAAPQQAVDLSTGAIATPPWVGLTAHGPSGVRLWYRNGTSTAVLTRTLTLSNGTITASSATTIYTPASSGATSYDITAHDSTYAYLLTLSSGAATSVAISRITIATNAVATATIVAASTTDSRLAISSADLSGGRRVAIVVSLAAGTSSLYLLDGDSMSSTPIHSATGVLVYGDPIAGFWRSAGSEYVVYGCANVESSFPNDIGLQIEWRTPDASGGVSATGAIALPWTRPITRIAHYEPSSEELYPIFAAQLCYNDEAQRLTLEPEWLSDPAVDVFKIEAVNTVVRVGRFGVDKAHVYSTTGGTPAAYNSNSIHMEGAKLALVYAETTGVYPDTDFPMRFVEMDFAARQPRYAFGSDGVAIIAAALPVEWDGMSISEICSPARPKVNMLATGGTGLAPAAGDYLLSAVASWYDAAGVKHRSMPAQAYEYTANGVDVPRLRVTLPKLARSWLSGGRCEVEVYSTDEGDVNLYRNVSGTHDVSAYNLEVDDIQIVLSGVGLEPGPFIYTDGTAGLEVPAQQPGAFYDVAVVNERGWALDAERRNRWMFTKPKRPGIAYEWSTEFEVFTPPAAGDGVAVIENGGLPTLFCKNGVWVVTGGGPDATNVVGEFNPPEQISDIGCTSRDSVVKTPAGVMYISHNRFVLLGGGGQRVFETVDATDVGLGNVFPVVLRKTSEVVFFSSSGTHYVYNYALDRWSSWDTNVCPLLTACAFDPISEKINIVRQSDGAVMQIDPDVASTTAQMSFTTGRMVFGGLEDDNAMQEVIIRAKRAGAHGLSVTFTSDHGSSSLTKTISAANITSIVEGDQYTVSVSPPAGVSMRACKLTITETGAAGNAFQPIAVTVLGGRNGNIKRDAVRPAGKV